jgi:hypothetical protein
LGVDVLFEFVGEEIGSQFVCVTKALESRVHEACVTEVLETGKSSLGTRRETLGISDREGHSSTFFVLSFVVFGNFIFVADEPVVENLRFKDQDIFIGDFGFFNKDFFLVKFRGMDFEESAIPSIPGNLDIEIGLDFPEFELIDSLFEIALVNCMEFLLEVLDGFSLTDVGYIILG